MVCFSNTIALNVQNPACESDYGFFDTFTLAMLSEEYSLVCTDQTIEKRTRTIYPVDN